MESQKHPFYVSVKMKQVNSKLSCSTGSYNMTANRSQNRTRKVIDFTRSLKAKLWNHPLKVSVILGLVVRFLIAPFTGWVDLYFFWRLMTLMLANPTAVIFQYPPPWYLTFFPLIRLLAVFQDPSSFALVVPELGRVWYTTGARLIGITSPTFNFLFKTPIIFGDLLTGLVIHHVVREIRDETVARRAFSVWFLNPFVIFVSCVMGQSESILTFFMLASLYLICKEKYVSGGACLGLSIFYKTYNAYVAIFYLLMILFSLRNVQTGAGLRRLSLKGLDFVSSFKFLVGFGLPFLMLLPSIPAFGETYLQKASLPSLGGFSIWFISLLPSMKGIIDSAYSNWSLTLTLLLAIGVGTAIVLGLLVILRMKGALLEKMIYGTIGILAVAFATMPLTNPHMIVPLFPFLVIAVVLYNQYYVRFNILWLSCIGFVLSIWGVAIIFYPTAVYTPLITVEAISRFTLDYWNTPGLINQRISWDLLLVFSSIGIITILSFILSLLSKILRRPV
jgi:Gpi18-like mannosyltransferase